MLLRLLKKKCVSMAMFVIEDLCIDAKKIIGDEKGNIYLLQRDRKRLICTSFSDYIEKCKYRK